MIDAIVAELRDQPGLSPDLRARLGRPVGALQVHSRWVGRGVWALFERRARQPLVVVKLDHHRPYHRRLEAEHAALTALQGRPELAGTVPQPVALWSSGSRKVMVQTGLRGVPMVIRARSRLRPSPRRSAVEHRAVLGWLRVLQRVDVSRSDELRAAALLTRLEERFGHTPEGRKLVGRVEASRALWDGARVARVDGHGDLAGPNCLFDRGAVRVIDWEAGVGVRPASEDLVSFLTHYARVQPGPSHRLLSPVEAFAGAWTGGSWLTDLTARSFLAHLAHLGLPGGAAEAVFLQTALDLAEGAGAAAHGTLSQASWSDYLDVYGAAVGLPAIARLAAAQPAVAA